MGFDRYVERASLYLSVLIRKWIGYALGATSGAAMAAKEIGKQRTILFIGDGSFELTVQEVLGTLPSLAAVQICFI